MSGQGEEKREKFSWSDNDVLPCRVCGESCPNWHRDRYTNMPLCDACYFNRWAYGLIIELASGKRFKLFGREVHPIDDVSIDSLPNL